MTPPAPRAGAASVSASGSASGRRAPRWTVALAAALFLAAAPAAGAQSLEERAVRFPVATVGDSTFTFPVGPLRWVKPGARGMAVDPRRRDALVARFQVLGVDHGMATALVTGETTRLTPDHVALLERPVRPWYASGTFWAGTLLGLLGGAVLVSH